MREKPGLESASPAFACGSVLSGVTQLRLHQSAARSKTTVLRQHQCLRPKAHSGKEGKEEAAERECKRGGESEEGKEGGRKGENEGKRNQVV